MNGNVVHITAEQLNANDEAVTIVELFCEHGAFVEKGTHVLTIETSKAAAEIRSPADGFIALAGKVGTVIDVGKNIATLYSTLDALLADQPVGGASQLPTADERTSSADAPRATRKAIDLARDLGVDIADIPKVCFIREEDVRQHVAQATKIARRDRVDLSRVKKATVRTLEISRNTVIPACLLAEFQFPLFEGKKLDVFDLVIHRAARLIEERYPDCNAYLDGDAVVRFSRVNFGFLVDVDGDVFMPVIRNAGSLSLNEIAAIRADHILALFRGEQTQDMLAEPTVCASGLNGRHLTFQMPVVYPATSLIIGVNQRVEAGSRVSPVYLTLAYDHRVLSGFIASRFADDLIESVCRGP
jgi:2-oxoglutarate dehydrogenase E2 component (dihydrolipoamide succinyltransferase)